MAAPVVTNVTATNADGTYRPGVTISATVTFDQSVDVVGVPQLALKFYPTTRQASYASGTGTATLTFTYLTVAGDAAIDLDYVAVGSLTLNGGTIQNAGLENATLTLAAPGAATSLGANKEINVGTVYSVAFKAAGVPSTGLTPTITSPKLVSTGSAYSGCSLVKELAGGAYKFAADPSEAVYLYVDGSGTLVNADRYIPMIIGPQDAYLDATVTSRLAPTVALRTLDVASTGEAGLDFDNVKAASAPTTLTNITVPTVTTTATATSVTSVAANGITATSLAADAINAAALKADALTAIATAIFALANGIETGVTPKQALRAIAAMLAGDASGGPAGSVFKGLGVATTRVSATAAETGDRTMVLNL